MTELTLAQGVILILAVIAALTDLIRGKIYNVMTFPAILGGLVFASVQGGFHAFALSLGAMVLALVLFGILYLLKVISAGDVKYLMALGAWGGVKFTLDVALLSLLIGGVFAVVILIVKNQMPAFLLKLRRLILSLVVRELEFEIPKANPQLKMPYGIPMSFAVVLLVLEAPWIQKFMGILRPW